MGQDINEQLLDAVITCDITETMRLLEPNTDIEIRDDDGWTPLIWASWNGCTEIVKLLIDRGANIDAKDNNGCTAMSWAFYDQQIDTAKLLLDRGSDIENINDDGFTYLSEAIMYKLPEIVKILLDHGVDTEYIDSGGYTPMRYAIMDGQIEIVKLLLEYSADINNHNGELPSYLCYEREMWVEEYVQELIINKQPHNIKLLSDMIGIRPEMKEKYKDIIELSLMGLF